MNVRLPGLRARKFGLHISVICAFFLAFAEKASSQSSQSSYLQPVATGVQFTAMLSANDTIGGYRMSGIPDGLGAFDNGDGTFTLLMNHELTVAMGVPRAHGSKGAFVSKWIVNKSDLRMLSGSDLIKRVNLWNPATSTYTLYDTTTPSSLTIFGRFCSADLPAVSAFYNAATGKGTRERIFMNGEETNDESRAFAHIVTGVNGGTSWELPALGKAAWENSVANWYSGDKTVVGEMNDGTDGQVYFYIGTKTNTGTEIEKAGLTNGHPFGVKVDGFSVERVNSSTINLPPAPGTRFSLVDMGDVRGITGAQFNTNSNAAGVTKFSRPEDGAWDPSHPNDFYFNTTDQIDQVNDAVGTQVGRSRVWRLRFDDINHPENGGTIEAVVDGTEGINMLDNMTIDKNGHILLCEDVGNSAHNGKVWQYDIATDALKMIGKHDPARFGDIGVPATAPFNVDEETSGVLDMQDILGPGKFLITVQAHYTSVPVDIAEGGQLLQIYDPYTANLQGPSSSQSSYLLPVAPKAEYTAIMSANDSVGGYKMAGIPDGLGAFDNGDGTFTLLMNHELTVAMGVPRAHGSKGAFVSKWIVNKSDLRMLSGSDLIKRVNLWNPATSTYTLYDTTTPSSLTIFGRFCSADLPAVSAFYNAATGKGTRERIFMNGEETNDESRAFAHIVTGVNGGTSWELPALGKAAWENSVANWYSGDKTVVGEMNDGTDGQVYFYIGTKTNTGTEIEKAGLTNGHPFGVKVDGFSVERVNSSTINLPPAPGTRFSLVDMGDVRGITGAQFNTNSNAAGVTKFSRPEDGAWDPSHPNDFYFNTTDQIDQVNDGVGTQVGRSRVWRLRFDDIKNPELGGTIAAVVDGTEGINMLDNMTIDKNGHILLCEDVGNSAHNGKVWQYNIATDSLIMIGKHDPARFGDIGVPATAPFNVDEETSGVLDMQDILGPGKFLITVQAHYTSVPVAIAEGGQLLQIYDPYALNVPPTVAITSPANGSTFNAGAPITVTAQASDVDGSVAKVVFYEGVNKIGEDTVAPYEFTGAEVEPGSYRVTARAYDNVGDSAVTDTVRVTVAGCTGSGSISVEGFTDIPGSALINLASNAKYPNHPDVTEQLITFEYGPNIADNYGARVRGYICAPATGDYTFYLTSDDQSELWLSTDEKPANMRRIAYIQTAVGFRAWLANATGRSLPIHLVKGGRYYVETVHKESNGNDHLSVGWVLPGGIFEGPVAGSRLSPYQQSTTPQVAKQDFPAAMAAASSVNAPVKEKKAFTAIATPNPSSSQFTIEMSSSSDAPVTLKMLDIAGKILEVRSGLSPNGIVQVAATYRPGIYFAELIQGDKKVRLKLLKQ
jgi:secreted PhoX family phosphatase